MLTKNYRLFFDKACNSGKIHAVEELHLVYLDYLSACIEHIKNMRTLANPLAGDEAQKSKYFLFPPDGLGVNYRNWARTEAYNTVKTWIRSIYEYNKHRKISMKALIMRGDYSDEMKHSLCILGKYPTKLSPTNSTISEEAKNLFWSMLLDEKVAGKFPTRSAHSPLQVSTGLTAILTETKHAKIPLWLRLSTLKTGERLNIPLVPNPNVPDISQVKVISLNKSQKGRRFVNVLVETPELDLPDPKTDLRVGLDVGLNCFVATSDGWRWGENNFKNKFMHLRTKILGVRHRRQKQGLKFYPDSKRLNRLEARLTGMIKSYAGRATNILRERYPGHVFVIEALDLQGTRNQKRSGYKAVHNALVTKVLTEEVNPAYTSQQCPSCGYIHGKNRSKNHFKCRACGRQLHADTVGARNVLGRSVGKHVALRASTVEARIALGKLYWLRRNPDQDCPESFNRRSNHRARLWKPARQRRSRKRSKSCPRIRTSEGILAVNS